MSLKASAWAWQVRVDSPITKLVLVALADFADDSGIAWPSMDTLAAMTRLSRRSIIRGVLEAKNNGLLEVTKRGNTSSRYRLILAPPLLANLPARSATESQQEMSRSATESQHEVPHSPPVVTHRRIASATESQNPSRNRQRTTIEPLRTAPEGAGRTNGHSGMVEDLGDLFGGGPEPTKDAKPKPEHCSPDYQPGEEARKHAADLGLDLPTVLRAFLVHWTEGKGRTQKRPGWDRTFMVWCDNDAARYGKARNGHGAVRDYDAERAAERSRKLREMLAEDMPK